MADDTSNISALGATIPQLFFDIIAWLIPGAFAIMTFSLAAVGPEKLWDLGRDLGHLPSENYPPVILIIGLGTVVSYVFAIILNGLWYVLEWICKRLSKKTSGGSRQKAEKPPGDSQQKDELRSLYHAIKQKSLERVMHFAPSASQRV
jgi:hypothetical protein